MVVGTAALLALHVLRLTFVNVLLLVPLCLILLGLMLHIWSQKEESRY